MTTDTERPGEDFVPVPHFEARLWDELARVHEQRRARPDAGPSDTGPGGPDAGADADRPGHRRSWSLRVGIGLVAGAAAVAVAGVLVVRDPGDGGDPGTASSPTGGPATTAPPVSEPPVSLETRVVNAIGAVAADSVVKVTQVEANGSIGDSIMWADQQSGLFRSLQRNVAGEDIYDSGPATPPAVDAQGPEYPDYEGIETPFGDPSLPRALTRTVDHCFGQYTEADALAPPGGGWTTTIREQIEAGELVADGTQVHEGRELLKFEEIIPDQGITDLAWVLIDPDTYRPLYRVGYPGSDAEYAMTFEYLPRTPENLAQLAPPVPAGFELVDQLHGDGERNDAGCSL